ncbi:MAG: sodium/solute symporter [bacterium]|nr:sodium/solute symporter [bacterium]
MNILDWSVVFIYMVGMVALAVYAGRKQKKSTDYYLGGNRMNHWAISLSTMATQCSTNSLLGAPAFVIGVGGLLWLQYELAVPLAMIAVMLFLLPFFRKQNLVSVYEYLEKRLGPGSRTMLSLLFQFLRAFSTGVTVYGISIVLQELLHIPYWTAVLLIGIITIVYDFLGGIRAVVYSDVIQMIILYSGIAVCLFFAVHLTGGWSEVWASLPADKANTLDFSGSGLSTGENFTFWPMLIGGFFLYVSYYGCDQTQVQRELSTRSVDDTNMSLFINGILRFPLVVTYCLLGAAIAAFIVKNPGFLDLIVDPTTGETNFNIAVPVFCLHYLPHGVIGLIMVSLVAAAMSSLDSTINSLSAVSMKDIIERYIVQGKMEPGKALKWSRWTTVFWGAACMFFSFFVGNISDSIIESINKIGSLTNGPILATFLLATLTRRANDKGAMIGIIAGFLANLLTWLLLPQVSWWWWNVSGCVITFGCGYLASSLMPAEKQPDDLEELVFKKDARTQFGYKRNWTIYRIVLVIYFFLMLGGLALFHFW